MKTRMYSVFLSVADIMKAQQKTNQTMVFGGIIMNIETANRLLQYRKKSGLSVKLSADALLQTYSGLRQYPGKYLGMPQQGRFL